MTTGNALKAAKKGVPKVNKPGDTNLIEFDPRN